MQRFRAEDFHLTGYYKITDRSGNDRPSSVLRNPKTASRRTDRAEVPEPIKDLP